MRRLALLATLAVLLVLVASAGAVDVAPVRATALYEDGPVAGGGYLAWTQNSRKHPRLFKVYANRGTEAPFLVPTRRQAATGSISGTTLAYQEFSPARGESSIRFYDLEQRRQLTVPKGVNTALWEWRPSLSGEWLLFSRHNGRSESVLLLNIKTRAQLELDRGRMPDGRNYAIAGQVNGNYAVWHHCARGGESCTVFRYDIAARTKTPLRPPFGFIHYAASVATDGTTYLVRSEPDCGASVELWRYPLVGEPAFLVGLPAGRDIATTFVETQVGIDGPTNHVYHDRLSCRASRSDLWRYTDVILPQPTG